MKLLELNEAIKNPLECEEFQLKNWLNTLKEYIEKDLSNGWIPVSDRLPDEVPNYYLCTDSNGEVEFVYRYHFFNGDRWMCGMRIKDNVIAWQPIPEAYKVK